MEHVIAKFRENKLLTAAFLFAALSFGASLVFEYGFGERPCYLCLWQRWPMLAACVFALFAIFSKWKTKATWALIAVFGKEFVVAAYHLQVQFEILSDPCVLRSIKTADMFWESLNAPLPCSKVTWTILGVPVAAYNAVFSLGFVIALAEFVYFKANRTVRPVS